MKQNSADACAIKLEKQSESSGPARRAGSLKQEVTERMEAWIVMRSLRSFAANAVSGSPPATL
jgi:hypothetical protein